jgi:Ras-related protein Rab-4B
MPRRRRSRSYPRVRHHIASVTSRPTPCQADLPARRQSFSSLARWLTDCRALASPHLVTVLVGNKLDRGEEEREVEYAEGSRWAEENGESAWTRIWSTVMPVLTPPGLLFVEVSSLTGENATTPFLLAARTILSAVDAGTLDPDSAGTGVSYGERQLRAVGSSSRLSTAFGGSARRKRRESVTLSMMVGKGDRCSC